MAADRYSRFVTAAKIVLPLSALGLLSTIFLFSGEIDPTQSIPYAELSVDQMIQEQRISAPNYAAVTENGVQVLVTASASRPDPNDAQRVLTDDIQATLTPQTGAATYLEAPTGIVDNASNTARLDGGLVILNGDASRFVTEALTSNLDTTEMISDGPVSGTTAFGRLDAGLLHVLPPTADRAAQWVFQDGVKLVYQRESGQDE